MNAFFWQILVLIIFAVVIGMMIGYFLRRYFHSKDTVGRGTAPRKVVAEKAAADAAAIAAAPLSIPVPSPAPLLTPLADEKLVQEEPSIEEQEAAAVAMAEETNRQLADEHVDLDASSQAEADSDAETARIDAVLAALPKDASNEQKADAVGQKPTLLSSANGKADDLKRIKGIGKVIETKLNELGVYHYEQIAKWNRDEVNWITTFLSFKGRVDREEWIPQAKALLEQTSESAEAKDEKAEEDAKAKARVGDAARKAAAAVAASEVASEQPAVEPAMPEPAAVTEELEPEDEPVDLEAEEKRIAEAIAALPKDASPQDKANAAGKKPKLLKKPRKAGADDLKRIKGVGKVLEGKLNDLGIYHFDQIAAWKRPEINWVTTFLSFKGRVDREEWVSQAKLLAAGEETEFSKRVDKGEVESSKK